MKRNPPLYYLAVVAMTIAIMIVIESFVLVLTAEIRSAALLIATGIFSYGFGEYINHPLVQQENHAATLETDNTLVRKRRPCLAGIILVLASALFIFAGLMRLMPFQSL
ncbi:hypothetical protein [Desulfosediminicola ganghwensis]|uniref:hypothetical protein n=1 Tax=Desulfosediminicola ganghwensis TaxID=2569540 RepID=UPI0010ACDC9F|nr:hypothetical protein [Desulfosediminicola ganghwensis]